MLKSIIQKLFFCYNAVATVGANSSLTPSINFSNDSDFVLKEIRNTQQAAGAIKITIKLASGEQFSNQALDSRLFAEGFNGVKFFEDVIIPKNTQFDITMQNTTGGNLTHEIQFWGYKI